MKINEMDPKSKWESATIKFNTEEDFELGVKLLSKLNQDYHYYFDSLIPVRFGKDGKVTASGDQINKIEKLFKQLNKTRKLSIEFIRENKNMKKSKLIKLIREELDLLKEMDKLPDLRHWWKEDKNNIISYIYWLKDQLPPQDKRKKEAAWNTIKQNLNKKYPKPKN